MRALIDYTLGPLWLLIGIMNVVEGNWWGYFALGAGILWSVTGYNKFRAREKGASE